MKKIDPRDFRSSIEWPPVVDEGYRGLEEVENWTPSIPIGVAAQRAVGLALEGMKLEPQCDSPIETQLGAQLKLDLPERFKLVPQYWFDRFRIDFAIILEGKPHLFIECDGKEFHSSHAQLENDAAKDRAAARAGIPLLRFTGSSIYRKPKECCRRIIDLLKATK